MKTLNLLKTLLLVMTLSTVSCVQDPCALKDDQSVKANGNSLQTKNDCDADDGGSVDEPDDGSDTTPPPVDTNPEDTIEESFYSPWKSDWTAIVIDAYQGNSIDWNKMAQDERMVGVIHRSSIGLRVDTKYKERRAIAKERGYLWGAYHLGYKGDVQEQVDLFLDLVDGDEETLMILDLEDTTNGLFMTIDEAVTFMEMVYERTGRIPVVYANHSTTKKLNQKVSNNPILQQSKLWYARFKSNVYDYPAGIWPNYFLWQFSSEINCSKTGSCLYNVPGTRYDMDVNVYYGTVDDLRANWNNY
tara:strand:- start:1293 stop:2198 length:906 start_codon:yes stop_codon:yes gene_type:complete